MMTAKGEDRSPPVQTDRPLIAGRLRLHERIGANRLGEIYAAVDEGCVEPGTERHVAVQVVPESIVSINKLFNRINVAYTLLHAAAHPNIVPLLHFGRDGSKGVLIMALLDGAPLRDVLGNVTTMPLSDVKPVIRGVGEALELMHSRDLVHGQLTTGKVFITRDFEVRLLDVLPVDRSGIPGSGATAAELQSAGSTRYDVFGLACLAYEMLAGHAPFGDGRTPAAAVGKEPERIDMLEDKVWNALRLALDPESGQRRASVTAFLHEFGIAGTERLGPISGLPARQTVSAGRATELAAPPAPAAETVPQAPAAIRVAPADAAPARPSVDRPPGKQRHPLRAAFLGALLTGLAAWAVFGPAKQHMTDLMAWIDARTNVGPAPQGVAVATPAENDEQVPLPNETIAEAVASEAGDGGESAASPSERAAFAPIVSVSERDGVVRIVPPPYDAAAAPLMWWTSEHTATGDEDFIAVAPRAVGGVPINDDTTLHIPLINDHLPEPPESFFVHYGFRDTPQAPMQRIATVRVDILDDD